MSKASHSSPAPAHSRSAPLNARRNEVSTTTSTVDSGPAAATRRRRNARHAASAANPNRNTAPARPTQSPQRTIRVGAGSRALSTAVSTAWSPIEVFATTSPVSSMIALSPLVVTRTCGSRVSMLRKAATARCRRAPIG